MNNKNEVEIIDDFEGAMIGKHEINSYNIYLDLKKEKPTIGFNNKKWNYNLHFNFGIHNFSKQDKTYKIFINCKNFINLKGELKRLWISDNVNKEFWMVKDIFGRTNFHGKYYIEIKIKRNQILYIANYPPIKYSKLKEKFEILSKQSKAKKVVIGYTVENRPIISYEIGDIFKNPTILFVSGFHPPERDTIAIEAIMEKFENNEWRSYILKKYSFSFIPILNPDGFANAMQGSNINEINFHWKFFGNSENECPEAIGIWRYCSMIKPIIFFDFHSFTFQNNTARPYLIPPGYYCKKSRRKAQRYINKSLRKLCENSYSKNEIILSPNLLSSKLRSEFDTITIPKFHLHMKDGLNESKKMALDCLKITLEGLKFLNIKKRKEKNKSLEKKNCNIIDRIRINILDFWFFKVKSILKRILASKSRR